MKINWGTGIVIAFVLFISFILYFVLKVQSDSKYDNDLVVEDYYVHDMGFSDEMKRVQNAHDLKTRPEINLTDAGVKVSFPESFSEKHIKGTVTLYRASNKKLDFVSDIKLENSTMLITDQKLIQGVWKVNMEWEYEGKKYLTKEEIYVH
ncbi:FixH family protein [Flavobacterium sp. TMP13]|uniref:FixH family protein n=1 Tax=unclassified Flavobacterium TaxID=196869 RepID=UPI00076D91B8|nr:FixH family protein [Flavobacterium sp. TAB 87]KVV15151.1 FixH [Flavobacterium sp. TAB 87]